MSKPTTIDEYLAGVGEDRRKALQQLRESIRSIVPEAEEGFSYGLPAFRVRGKAIAGFAATANGCSYYPMSGATIATLSEDLEGYETTKGSIHFDPQRPLPEDLVRKLIQTRMTEGP